jgi:hypothetical protein
MMSIRPVVLGFAGRFLFARRSVVCAESDIGKFKIAVGTTDANGLKCPGF